MRMMLRLVANYHIFAGGLICCLRLVQALATTRILGRALLLLVPHIDLLLSTPLAPWVLRWFVIIDSWVVSWVVLPQGMPLFLPKLINGFLISITCLKWLNRSPKLLMLHLLNLCSVNGSFSSVLSQCAAHCLQIWRQPSYHPFFQPCLVVK